MAELFTSNGFAFFAPLRRGHTASNSNPALEIKNTGQYIDECILPGTHGEAGGLPPNSPLEVPCLQMQVSEVTSALNWLGAWYYNSFDLSHVALLGHSFGGSLTLMAAATSLPFGPKAAIDISGSALDWDDNLFYGLFLPGFVSSRKMPIFFLQASNEKSLEPTMQLSAGQNGSGNTPVGGAGRTGNHMFQAAFYPPVLPDPPTLSNPLGECPFAITDLCAGPGQLVNKKVHGRFVTRSEHVQVWGPSVLDFLKRYGVS